MASAKGHRRRLRGNVLAVQEEDVLPALVIVALPADTAPADADVLLQACSRAYEGGECEEPKDERPEFYVMAEVVWITDTQAEVNVSFETVSTERSAYRTLDFRPDDEDRERYRALGFAVGSLAGKLAHSVEPSRESEPTEEPTAVEPEPARAVDEPETPPSTSDTLPSVYAPLPLLIEHDYRFGLGVGTGVRAPRWGAMLGARRIYDRRLVLEASGAAYIQGSNPDGVEATFLNASVSAGVRFDTEPVDFCIVAGPAFQLQMMERSETDASGTANRLGADATLTLRYSDGTITPFAELRGSYFRIVDVELADGVLIPFGPWQVHAAVGVVLTPK